MNILPSVDTAVHLSSRTTPSFRSATLALALAMALSACGGGGSPANQAPVARLTGPVAPLFTGEPVKLDARDSLDADGDTLTFEWALTAVPAGSAAVLGQGTNLRFLVPDVAGRYDISLRVTDGKGGESRVNRSLDVQAAAPLAIMITESEPVSGLIHLRLNRETVLADVQWLGDGVSLNAVGQRGYLPAEWETGYLSDGPHVVQAKLSYEDGTNRTVERSVQVLNPTIKLTRPYVETFVGRAAVYVEPQSIHGIDQVSLSFKGAPLGALSARNSCALEVCQGAPTGYAFTVYSNQTGTGPITLDLTITDLAGNRRTVAINVDMKS